MPWNSMSDRLANLPVILAGPVLRRVEPDRVTVWLAAREPCTVTLRILEPQPAGADPVERLASAPRPTVPLGDNLHVAAVTAAAGAGGDLVPGVRYHYDLVFACDSLRDAQGDPEVAGLDDGRVVDTAHPIHYDSTPLALPGFSLPPADLDRLRLVHSSCRKPHGEGADMLALVDGWIDDGANDADARPHQLFLTGDQIYADDVADALLVLLSDAAQALLGWSETLPGVPDPAALLPGRRMALMERAARFTSGEAESHLARLGEFYAMYLLAWAPGLWPPGFAALTFEEFFPAEAAAGGDEAEALRERFDGQKPRLDAYLAALPAVRRVLANVPTYMIFDDHEVTDDWFLYLGWCLDTLRAPLGRRIIQNGMLAYALFQAWGNTPGQFAAGGPGAALLDAAARWRDDAADPQDAAREAAIYGALGLPDPGQDFAALEADGVLRPFQPSVRWHYRVPGPSHQVLVLDARTGRRFPKEGAAGASLKNPPELLTADGLDAQLPAAGAAPPPVTLVVSPTPVQGLDWIDAIQTAVAYFPWVGGNDAADYEAWRLQAAAVHRLLARAARQGPTAAGRQESRCLFLSGDVHYGYAARLRYAAPAGAGQPAAEAVLAQFTASALKNEARLTRFAHNNGYGFLTARVPALDLAPAGEGACYQPAYVAEAEPPDLGYVPVPGGDGSPAGWLGRHQQAAANHQVYAGWSDGTQVVGHNNVGEIRFEAGAAAGDPPRAARQTLHWRRAPGEAVQSTHYRASLALEPFDCD